MPSTPSYTKNPYNIKILPWISIHLNGNTQGIRPLKPNYASHQYVRAYISLFSGTGKVNRDEDNDVIREDYSTATRWTPLISARNVGEGHLNLANNRVEFKLEAALSNTATIVSYAEFEDVIEIDRKETSPTWLLNMNTKDIFEYLKPDPECCKIFNGV